MHKLATKIIAVVLVLTMAISGLVINTSAYSLIAGVVDVIHILTDMKVTDGPILADITTKLTKAGVSKFIDTIKVLAKSGIEIDDLVDAIHKITDSKVTDAPDFVGIAKAIISAAKNPGIIDLDELVDFLKVIADLPLDSDALKTFIAKIVGNANIGGDVDLGAFKKVIAVIVDLIKGAGLPELPDTSIPDIDLGDIDLGNVDLKAFIDLINGLMKKDIKLPELKDLIVAIAPDFDFGSFDLDGLLAKIKGGDLDLPTLKDFFDKIGLPKFDNDTIKAILKLILGGIKIELPDVGVPSIPGGSDVVKPDKTLEALLDLLNGLKDKDITLPELKDLIIAINPDFDFGSFDLEGFLAKIKGGDLDLPTLKDFFDKIGLDLDPSVIVAIIGLIFGDGEIKLPDLEEALGKLPNIDIKDPIQWIKDLLDKIAKDPADPSDPKDPADPADPKDPADPADPSTIVDPQIPADPQVQETLQDVDTVTDLVTVGDDTPQATIDDNDFAVANTGDSTGVAATVTLALIAGAAYVTALKKKED